MRGVSVLSSMAPGLCSGDGSCGDLMFEEGGGEVQGLAEVGLLAVEEDTGLDRSSAITLELRGELRESLRVRTGEDVREGMERGGGEENFLQRRGDFSLGCSLPVLLERVFWLVAKKSSRDLSSGEHNVTV